MCIKATSGWVIQHFLLDVIFLCFKEVRTTFRNFKCFLRPLIKFDNLIFIYLSVWFILLLYSELLEFHLFFRRAIVFVAGFLGVHTVSVVLSIFGWRRQTIAFSFDSKGSEQHRDLLVCLTLAEIRGEFECWHCISKSHLIMLPLITHRVIQGDIIGQVARGIALLLDHFLLRENIGVNRLLIDSQEFVSGCFILATQWKILTLIYAWLGLNLFDFKDRGFIIGWTASFVVIMLKRHGVRRLGFLARLVELTSASCDTFC